MTVLLRLVLLEKALTKSLVLPGPAAAKPGPGNRIKKAPAERPGLALCGVLVALSGTCSIKLIKLGLVAEFPLVDADGLGEVQIGVVIPIVQS